MMLMVVFPQGTFIPTSRAVGRSENPGGGRGGSIVVGVVCPFPGWVGLTTDFLIDGRRSLIWEVRLGG